MLFCNISVPLTSEMMAMPLTVDNTCLYPNYKLLSQYFCYLNVCNTEIMMCGWKDRLCCSFWISSSMNADLKVFNTRFTSQVSVELEQRMFCRRPWRWERPWQRLRRKHDDGRPSDSSTWAVTKHASHTPGHSRCEAVLIDIAESLSSKNKNAWVFESIIFNY